MTTNEHDAARSNVSATELPFETQQLRAALSGFLDQIYTLPDRKKIRLGAVVWGVYAFFDYDGEPIYVGQTKERIGTRIRRHLTNQRTDAVAMNVLDPFEVHSITVWPLPEFQSERTSNATAKAHLNALEHAVFRQLLKQSEFNAVLNEKNPPEPTVNIQMPASISGSIVSKEVSRLRDHPDLRIAHRAATLAKLAQVISERKVQKGLRHTLLAQAQRLQALAQRRYDHAADMPEDSGDE
ncbi:GIY-YIG nuclease family protein [Ottowia sp.]|uniref:GIY-YIG nuclease family protein n=1 Tax=Ottowia sp. TaxID=1898956 RepID=UPI003A8400B7